MERAVTIVALQDLCLLSGTHSLVAVTAGYDPSSLLGASQLLQAQPCLSLRCFLQGAGLPPTS